MIGLLIGVGSLLGLLALKWNERHHGHRHGWFGHGPWSRGGRGPWGGGEGNGQWGPGPFVQQRVLEALTERLELTPGQREKVRAVFDQLREQLGSVRGAAETARKDVAAALRTPHVDADSLGAAMASQDAVVDSAKKAIIDALVALHAILDDVQRDRLATLLEQGPFAAFRGEHGGRGCGYRRCA